MQRPARWTGQTTRTARILGTLAAACLSQVLVPTASAADSVACSWVLDVQNRLTDRLTVERAVRVDAPRFQPEDIACLCEGGAPLWVVQIAREELLLDGWAARDANALPLYAPESTFPISKQVALALVAQLRQSPSLYAEDGFYFQPFAGEAGAPTWFEMDRFSEAFTDASIALDASRSRRLALRSTRSRASTAAASPRSPTGPATLATTGSPATSSRVPAFLASSSTPRAKTGLRSRCASIASARRAKTTDTRHLDDDAQHRGHPGMRRGPPAVPQPRHQPRRRRRAPARQPGTRHSTQALVRLDRVGLAAVGGVLTAVSYAQYERALRNPPRSPPRPAARDVAEHQHRRGCRRHRGGATGAIGFALPIPKRVRATWRDDAR